jgi:RHS repeat-associated protein
MPCPPRGISSRAIAASVGGSRSIGYDAAAGEATNIMEQMSNGLPIAIFKCAWTNTGAMASEFAAPQPHSSTAPTRTMTYDNDNRLSTFQGPTMGSSQAVGLDADGNTINAPLTNDTFVSYAYDARNRLLNAGGVTNFYDAANNRIGQNFGTNNSLFVVNPNAKLPQVLMRIKNGVTNYYVYGPGLLYQITEAATGTNTLTYHYDYRGSTIALSADNGLVTDRIEYSLYALTTYRIGTNDTPFLFNGRYGVQTDPTGLLYMQARYYNPYLCRFVNPDPSGFAGGLNFYAYASGNPVSFVDPFGLCATEGWGGATATWLQNNIVDPLNSISTSSTYVNFNLYNAASLINGFADVLRLGQGTADATYNAQDGWDVAIGVTQDVGRAAAISVIVGGGLEGLTGDTTLPVVDDTPASTPVGESGNPMAVQPGANTPTTINE